MTHNDSQVEALSAEQILHLWDMHVGEPTPIFPLESGDKVAFARAVIAALSALAAGKGEAKPCPGIDERAAAWDAWFQQWQRERSYQPLTGDSFDAGYRLAWKRAHPPSPLSADPDHKGNER